MNLKSMSIDRLIDLRQRVNAALKTARLWINVEHSNPSFQSSLAFAVARRGQNQSDLVLGGKVAPKYRNPEYHSETWAGRGLKPRWLAVAIKAGKNPEDFLIAGAAKLPAARPRKKSSKARK